MKFDTPATTNPIDQLKVIGKPTDRIDGPLKTTGTAPYAYERHDVVPNQAYGYVIGASIAKGRIASLDASAARAAPGVLANIAANNGTFTVSQSDKQGITSFGTGNLDLQEEKSDSFTAGVVINPRSVRALRRRSASTGSDLVLD